MRESYKYDVTYGFPVSASKGDPAPAGNLWQLRILKTQGRERANVVALKHRGRWNFVNDLPSLGLAKLLAMVREGDVGGLVDYFMPDPAMSATEASCRPWRITGPVFREDAVAQRRGTV